MESEQDKTITNIFTEWRYTLPCGAKRIAVANFDPHHVLRTNGGVRHLDNVLFKEIAVITSALCLVLVFSHAIKDPRPMGADHEPHAIQAEGPTCVHGYWVNFQDVFFHAGDAAALNQYLTKKKDCKLSVRFHKGTKKARSPWDKADRPIVVDWCIITCNQNSDVSLEIWLGGKIKRSDLKLPSYAKIED